MADLHDLAQLQQAFDEEAASLDVKRLRSKALHIRPAPREALALRQIIHECRWALLALTLAALGHIWLYLALPA